VSVEQMARTVIDHGGHYDISGDETVALAQAYLEAMQTATVWAKENRRLREALEAAQDYLSVSLGDCEADCACILHVVRAALAGTEGER